jgi:phosphatidylglycerophosphatase A
MASGNHINPPSTGEQVPFLVRFLATGFYAGYAPWASGTMGTLVGLLIYLLPGAEHPAVLGGIIFLGLFAGVPAAAAVSRAEGNRLTRSAEWTKAKFQPDHHGISDPSMVVIDEMVGIWVTLLLLPKSPLIVLCAFIAFRAMDILKPEPARAVERVPNGWGIMLDDVVAGLYANLIVQVFAAILRTWAPQLL